MKSNRLRNLLAVIALGSTVLTAAAQIVPLDDPSKSSLDNTADGTYGGRFPFLRFRKPEPKPTPAKPTPAPTDICVETKSMPAEATLGKEFVSELRLVAIECAANVVCHGHAS